MAKKFYNESEFIFEEKPEHWRFEDLQGQKFNRLAVLGFAGKNLSGNSLWFCKCECGNIKRVIGSSLKKCLTTSCGCLQKQRAKETNTKHGYSRMGQRSRTYITWTSMIARCQNQNNKRFKDYGGRGIKVCERWHKFENFLADMGEAPEGLTIDRKENDKGYYKENCRWATIKEQNNNKSNNRYFTFNGKTQNLEKWTKELGFKKTSIMSRINRGWSIERALSTPMK